MAELFDFWPVGPVLRITFVQYLIAFSSRLEVTSDVISSENVWDVCIYAPVKFDDFSSNGSRDIQLPSRRMRHFCTFLNFDNCQPEVVSDVISDMTDQDAGMDVCANFCDSRLKL